MIDLSAVVAYLTAVSVVGAVVYLIMLSRRHPALSRPWESRASIHGGRLTKQFELFAELAPAELEVIVNAGREKRFCRGERIFTEGDPVDHVTMLLSGLVKVTQMKPNGSEVILCLNGAGEIVGSLGTNRKRLQVSRAQAVLPSDALVWDAGVFQKLLARIPTFRRNITRALEKHLSEMEQRYHEMSSQKVSSRLRSVLVRMANRLPRSTESRLEIPLSRSELAQLTGTTLFTVSRLLCQWQSQGIVTVRRQGLEIITLEKLREQGAVRQQDDESWVLPTAALASSISFTTGLFTTGTITRVVNGGLTRPSFSVTVLGSLETFIVSTTNLSTGNNLPGLGMGTFSSGRLTVRDSLTGAVLFTDTLSMG